MATEKNHIITAIGILTLMLLLPASAQAARQGKWLSGSVGNPHGARSYKLWVPSGYTGSARVPLVLMLHGCTQTADDFAAGTGMNAVADAHNFLVVYPEQPAEANAARCWNWFLPEHQARDAGEPALLAAVVREVGASYKVDAGRVYVAGISAGGAMAVILAVAYPDLFAGVGVSAGLEYKAATSLPEALAAQAKGGPDPNRQGQLAYQAMLGVKGVARRRGVPVIVFQGTLDVAVAPVNAEQVIGQWAQTNDYLDDDADNNTADAAAEARTSGSVPSGYNFTTSVYHDKSGKPLMEKWVVEGMRHAWSGGSSAGSYTDPKGPNASREMWRFFSGFKLGH